MAGSDGIQGTKDRFASAADRKVRKEAGGDPLVALLLAGSPDALACLYARYYREMLAFARSYTHDFAAAEDLVQDTWTGIIKGLPNFKGKSSFKTWAFKILSNKARTLRRRQLRLAFIKHLLAPQSDQDNNTQFGSSPYNHAGRWAVTPEELMLLEEFRQEMNEFIASLPPRQRRVYILRDIEGHSPENVCELLAISGGNQRLLLHRARAAIYEWYSARSQSRG